MAFSPATKTNLVDEMLSHLSATFQDVDPTSEVAKFYSGQSVFVTGATGFIGKALVEKLIRSCPDIKRIYLLIRDKKGKSSQERLEDLLKAHNFNRIKANPGGAEMLLRKLKAVRGDITLPGFGIEANDMKLLTEEISIVFNSAATIRFVEPIDVAVRNNISSVNELVNFCDNLAKLKAIVHLSTAYSNCHKRDTIEEIFYTPPMRGHQIIKAVESLREVTSQVHKYPSKNSSPSKDGDQIDLQRDACEQQIFYHNEKDIEPGELLDEFARIALRCSNRPNTYAFTKAISESHLLDLVSQRSHRYLGDGKIPVAIVRPSIVGGAWREPDVGYVDNYNGPTGAILSLYTGALQAMPGKGQRVADMVPVDMVSNMIICTGWYLVTEATDNTGAVRGKDESLVRKDKGVYVFNYVSGYRNPLRWHQVTDLIRELAYKYPSKFLVRLPSSYFIEAGKFYNFYDWLNHKLPAQVQDFVSSRLMGRELSSRSSSMAAYGRIRQMTQTLTPFTSNQWTLRDSNVCALNKSLTQVDRHLFPFDVSQIKWSEYIRNYIIGARIYTLKDEPRNLSMASRRLKT